MGTVGLGGHDGFKFWLGHGGLVIELKEGVVGDRPFDKNGGIGGDPINDTDNGEK